MIKSLNNIDAVIEKEIRQVYMSCKEYDGLGGNISLDAALNFNKDINNIFLLYDDKKLISFIFMFIPTCHEAEISAFTLPEYRGRGYFRRLLLEAAKEINKYNIKSILFVCEGQSLSGKEMVKSLGVHHDFTEYFLRYNNLKNPFDMGYAYKIKLYTPEIKDLGSLSQISMLTFNESYEDAESMIKSSLNTKDRKAYAAVLEGRMIGMGFASFEKGEVSIHGLGILPEFQGRGFGKELLLLIMRDLLQNGYENITLEVDSNNLKAFELYKRNGFEVEVAYDYYRKACEEINKEVDISHENKRNIKDIKG